MGTTSRSSIRETPQKKKKRKENMKSLALSAKTSNIWRMNVPLRRKNKKKAMKATWDDDSESESDDKVQEEIANMWFVAIDNEVKSLVLDHDDLLGDARLMRNLPTMNCLMILMTCMSNIRNFL